MNLPAVIDPADWTLSAQPTTAGVELRLVVPAQGLDAALALDRADAIRFASAILAAAGDGTMRTFPHPSIEGA